MIDVIIPVYHPDKKLEKLIDMLRKQSVKPNHVFFMVTQSDEQENKRVQKVCEQMPEGCIVPVAKKDFDHGGTRNLGISKSSAEFVLLMTQDAVPENEKLIEELQKAFQDERVSAAYGRQLADDKAGFHEAYIRQFNYPPQSSVKTKEDMERLGIKTFFCSNVCAMYRRSTYDELGGFVKHTIFNEDMILAAGMIRAGYAIAYVADATVVHSHKYTCRQQLTRNFDLAVSQKQYEQAFAGVKSESEGIRMVKKAMKHALSCGKWYRIPDLVMQSGFKFMGYRLGKKFDKLPHWLVMKCTMNPQFWMNKSEGIKDDE